MSERFNLFANRNALVIGQVTHDEYNELTPGGCAYYAAKTIEMLGGEVSLVTSVGLDFQFDSMLEQMRRTCRIGEHTTTFSNVYPAEGPRLQYVTSLAPPITLDLLPRHWLGGDLLLLAPVMGEIDGSAWKSIRDAGHVSMMLQGFMKQMHLTSRDGRHLVVPLEEAVNLDILDHVDSVFLSQEDIELFASSKLLGELVEKVKVVAVTNGKKGSRIYFDETYIDVGIHEANMKDPTGAGDTFASAMAMGLACDMSIDDAARLGAAAASLIVEGVGPANLSSLSRITTRWNDIPVCFEKQRRYLEGAKRMASTQV